MRRTFLIVPLLLTSLVYIRADDKQVEAVLKKQLVGKLLTVRGFYTDDYLQYDSNGQPRSKPTSGPWTLYGRVLPNSLRISKNEVELDCTRMLVAWRPLSDGSRHLSHIRGPRVLIELKLDGIPRDKARIKQLLSRVFFTSSEDPSRGLPEPWGSYRVDAVRDNAANKLAPAEPQQTSSAAKAVADPIRVEPGLVEGNLYKTVLPQYPSAAKAAKLEGEVVFNAVIGKDGTLSRFRVMKPLGLGMEESAVEAMRKWRYHPYLLNGEPVEVETALIVRYKLK